VTKNYQTNADDANALAVPEQASVAIDEIAADMREGELPVRAYELFNSTELPGRMGMERMLAGVSTRALKFAITSSRRGWHGPRAIEGNDILKAGRQAIRPSPGSLPTVMEVLIDRIFLHNVETTAQPCDGTRMSRNSLGSDTRSRSLRRVAVRVEGRHLPGISSAGLSHRGDLERSLRYRRYDTLFEFGNGGHSLRHAGAVFPETLRWIFRDRVKDR
jgi:hypothetical protein